MVDAKQSQGRHMRKQRLAPLHFPVLVLTAFSCAFCVESTTTTTTSDGWLRRRTDTRSSDRELIVNKKSTSEILSNPLTLLTESSGHKANISQYPYFAFWSHAYCGASLIAPDILLTAAHCGNQINPLDHKMVQMLTANRLEGGMNLTVIHQESHPNYNHELHLYDYQILKLDRNALLNPYGNATSGAHVIALNTDFYHPTIGTNVTAAGFGSTTPDATVASDFLMDVTMQRFPHTRCDEQYGPKRIPDELMLCMGVEGGGKDVCQGDSGGPIVDKNGLQVAIVGWGNGCAQANYFGANARVSAASEWIHQQVCRLSSYPPSTCHKGDMTSVIHRIPIHQHTMPPSATQTPNSGAIALTVTVKHDTYPRETSWDLRHLDSWVQMYWQPYDSVMTPYTMVHRVFTDLPGGTYQLRVGDVRNDGICCTYGNGSIAITATTQQRQPTVLWRHDGNFSNFLQYTFEINDNATLVWKEEVQRYVSSSLAASEHNEVVGENNPMKNDFDWPGAFPLQSEHNAMTVNVRHDDFPQQVEWAVWYYQHVSEATNATAINGTAINGTAVNVTAVNGTEVNGTEVNGTEVNATAINGTTVNGTSQGSKQGVRRLQSNADNRELHNTYSLTERERDGELIVITAAPVTAAPVTATPVTAAPATAPPVTAAPVTHPPATSSPITAAPITQPPVTHPPATTAPITNAPITAAPISASPVTSLPAPPASGPPVTASPVTGSPVTSSPVTAPPVTAPPVGIIFRDGEDGVGADKQNTERHEVHKNWFERHDDRLTGLRDDHDDTSSSNGDDTYKSREVDKPNKQRDGEGMDKNRDTNKPEKQRDGEDMDTNKTEKQSDGDNMDKNRDANKPEKQRDGEDMDKNRDTNKPEKQRDGEDMGKGELRDPNQPDMQRAFSHEANGRHGSDPSVQDRAGEGLGGEIRKTFSFGDFLFGPGRDPKLTTDEQRVPEQDRSDERTNNSNSDVFSNATNVKTGNATAAMPLQPTHRPSLNTSSTGLDPTKYKWTKLFGSGASNGRSNTVETHFFYHLKPGLYAFVLHDTEGDGICCVHRLGWITLLGNQTIIWSNNGQFSNQLEVILELYEDGTFNVVKTLIDGNDGSHIQQPHFLPAVNKANTTNSTTSLLPRKDELGATVAPNETRQ